MVSVTSQKSIVVITFLATDQNRLRTEGETGAIFRIWLDTELVTLISGVHLETLKHLKHQVWFLVYSSFNFTAHLIQSVVHISFWTPGL